MGKPWYVSRTTWVAILTTGAGILGAIAGQEWIADHPSLVSTIAIVTGVINMILRSITKDPIKIGV